MRRPVVDTSADTSDHLTDDAFRRLRLTVRHASRRLSADQVVRLADDLHAIRRRRRKGDPLVEPPSFLSWD